MKFIKAVAGLLTLVKRPRCTAEGINVKSTTGVSISVALSMFGVISKIPPFAILNPLLTNTGTSFTAVTVRLAVSTMLLKAVVPPFTVVSTLLPAASEVLSHARKVIVALPFQLRVGIKRILWALSNNKLLVALTREMSGEIAFQVVPSSEYCQAPFVVSTAVIAMASTAVPSGSVIEPSTIISATVFPAGLVVSSSIVVKVGLAAAFKRGASFTAMTLIARVRVLLLTVQSLTTKDTVRTVVETPERF